MTVKARDLVFAGMDDELVIGSVLVKAVDAEGRGHGGDEAVGFE
jgi:hypothetical protein